jgi:hypothetical protein
VATSEKYTTQPDLANRLSELQSRIEKLERGSAKSQVVFYSSSSNDVVMRAGTDPETGERGFTVGRDTGGAALEVNSSETGKPQSVKIYDHQGQVIVRDSETYQSGLSRPSLSHNVTHVTLALPAQTTTVYAAQAEINFLKSNPSVEVVYNVFSSDGATGVSLRFRELATGTQLRPRYGIANYEIAHNPAPAVLLRNVTPPLELPANIFNVGAPIQMVVEAYRFSGVGTFVVQVLAVRGSDEV